MTLQKIHPFPLVKHRHLSHVPGNSRWLGGLCVEKSELECVEQKEKIIHILTPRTIVKAVLKPAVFVLATLYFMVDAIFLRIATPLARWIARKRIFIRLRKWIGSLRPYPSLALFAVPVLILEPVKPVAAYLVSKGSFSAGMTVLAIGEILKLVIVERLFKLCRYKLLKIPLFARVYGFWRQGVGWVVSMPAWQAARHWVLARKMFLRNYFKQLKRSSTYRRFVTRLRIARTNVGVQRDRS